MDTVVFVDSQVIDFFLNDVVLAKVNAEVDTALARENHIIGYPTGVLFGSDGKEIDRVIGYYPTADFLKTLRDYQKGIGTLDDLLKRAETEKDRSLYMEIAEKFKYRGSDRDAERWYHEVVSAGEPGDSLSGDARIAMADMYRRAKDYSLALKAFKEVENDFKGTMHGMDAVIYQAIIYRDKGDTTNALKTFEDYVKRFPNSPDVDYARKSIERLQKTTTGS